MYTCNEKYYIHWPRDTIYPQKIFFQALLNYIYFRTSIYITIELKTQLIHNIAENGLFQKRNFRLEDGFSYKKDCLRKQNPSPRGLLFQKAALFEY